MTDKWKALERLRMRVADGNHADEDCNIINRAFRDFEQQVERLEKTIEFLTGASPGVVDNLVYEALATEEEA